VDAEFAASEDASAHTFVADLTDEVVIAGDDGHHLARVRRLQPGEPVTAADGAGTWRGYEVVMVARGAVTLHARTPPRAEPRLTPSLCVAFALTKGTKPEVVARQLTELGVDEIVAFVARRSVVRARGAQADALVGRLERVVREAAAQCRRARLPVVQSPEPFDAVITRPGLVVAERARAPATRALDEAPGDDSLAWTLVVGPEGGFDPGEAQALAGAPVVSVGPHVLRAETAAVAAAALLAARRHSAS